MNEYDENISRKSYLFIDRHVYDCCYWDVCLCNGRLVNLRLCLCVLVSLILVDVLCRLIDLLFLLAVEILGRI